MALIRSVQGHHPHIAHDVFLAENATIIGQVTIGSRASIWYQAVLRGDVNRIEVGPRVNIQDGSIIHGTYQKWETIIEEDVTVGHGVILHGCRIGKGSLIGMGSIVMDGAQIGAFSLVGAGSLVTEGKVFPPRSLILGRPAVVKRALTEEEIELLKESTNNYLLYSSWYQTGSER